MATFVTLGSNTWRVVIDGPAFGESQTFKVWRTRGADSNDQPRGWAWTVQAWRKSRLGGHGPGNWHTLPAGRPKATAVVTIVNRMLEEVR